MTDTEILSYAGKSVCVVVPTTRRTSLSVWGHLLQATNELTQELNYYINVGDDVSILFYATDVQRIEVSEILGVVIRLG